MQSPRSLRPLRVALKQLAPAPFRYSPWKLFSLLGGHQSTTAGPKREEQYRGYFAYPAVKILPLLSAQAYTTSRFRSHSKHTHTHGWIRRRVGPYSPPLETDCCTVRQKLLALGTVRFRVTEVVMFSIVTVYMQETNVVGFACNSSWKNVVSKLPVIYFEKRIFISAVKGNNRFFCWVVSRWVERSST